MVVKMSEKTVNGSLSLYVSPVVNCAILCPHPLTASLTQWLLGLAPTPQQPLKVGFREE